MRLLLAAPFVAFPLAASAEAASATAGRGTDWIAIGMFVAIVLITLPFDQAPAHHAGDEIGDGGAVEVEHAAELALAGPWPLIEGGERSELDARGLRADVA